MAGESVFNNFDLHIGQGQEGAYPVSVLYSPAGETPEPAHILPAFDEPMRRWLDDLNQGITDRDALLALGQRLADYLFPPGPVRDLYQRSLALVEARGVKLRLRLRISPPELAALPWEFTYDDGAHDFLALNPQTALVRYHSQPVAQNSVTSHAPVPILVLISNPPGTFPLETGREVRNLIEALSRLLEDNRAQIDVLFAGPAAERDEIAALVDGQAGARLLPAAATIDSLRDALRQGYRIIHYIGHGVFDERRGGALLLADERGKAVQVGAQVLAREARGSSVAVMVLNACLSATESAAQSFMGLAPNLIRVGVPAVVAMQYAIPDESAVHFSRTLYRALADGWPLDAAVTEGRKAISAHLTPDDMDWGIPVLFMRSGDGVLWVEKAGEMAVGSYLLQVGATHGSTVSPAPAGNRALPADRPVPVFLRPRAFPGLLDRETELDAAVSALQAATPVEFHAAPGLGKTALLRHLAHRFPPDAFPDGVVCLSARGKPLDDLLQALFEAFFATDAPMKPTDVQIRHALQGKRALVLLDDLELGRDDALSLLDAAPACAFLLASCERQLWGEGRALALSGLPAQDALALIERELGRALSAQERTAAEGLCAALEGHPLRLFQAAALAREEGRSLDQVAQEMAAPPAAGGATASVVQSLPGQEQQLLAVLAALGGVPLHTEHLSALAGLADAAAVLQQFQNRGLAQSHSPHYSLTGTLAQDLAQMMDLEPVKQKVLDYLIHWAEAQRQDAARLLDSTGAILHTLAWAASAQRWDGVLRLGRAVQDALILGGRWAAWYQVLQWMLAAARALGDGAAEAWALHQIGSRALCLGDDSAARDALGHALRLRESLGDRVGAALCRHNLQTLALPPAPPPPPPQAPPQALAGASVAPAMPLLAKGAIALVTAAVTVAGALGVWRVVSRPTPTPSPKPTVAAPTATAFDTATPTATFTASPLPPVLPSPSATPSATLSRTATVTPTATGTATSTATASITPSATATHTPTATVTVTPAVKRYPSPVLISPRDKAEFEENSYANLWWAWEGKLAEDEYYDVRFWQEGEPHYGVVWTKDEFFGVLGKPGITYYWAIAVIRGQNGKMVAQLSPESEARRLYWVTPTATPTFTPTATPTITPTATPTITPTATPDTTPPPAPSPLEPPQKASVACQATVRLVWTAVSDPSGIAAYLGKLERDDYPYGWQTSGWGPVAGNRNWIDVAVNCGSFYRWQVRAQDGAGNWSDWSTWSYFGVILD